MSSAQETWNSLYTNELETIWKCKPPELQKPAMIYFVLKQELQRVQDNLSLQLKEFTSNVEHQISSIKECELQQRQGESVTEPLSEDELNRSPKINKTRNISFKRRIPNLRLNLSKENLRRTEDLDVDIVESSPEVIFNRAKQKDVKKLFVPKTPTENGDMVDSSLVIPTTPGFSFPKKTNRKISKRSQTKEKSTTLTQLFKITPTSKSTKASDQFSPNFEKLEKILKDDSNDETFCDVKMETSDVKMEMSNVIKKKVKSAFKDYDKFPHAKPKGPLYAHKAEPVRRKADRMQLPGWSCDDCRKFYESSNLPPEVLQEKINACSRHRSKYNPIDETFAGFWDVGLFSTQDEENM